MSVNDEILGFLLEHDAFGRETDGKFQRIAEKGLKIGYAELSDAEKYTLRKWFTKPCCGMSSSGEHEDCPYSAELTDEQLLEAYEASHDPESVQCDSCRDEDDFNNHGMAKGR
ncbi:MAG: hypothetical protein ACRCWH_13880 [Aeromonas veronii]